MSVASSELELEQVGRGVEVAGGWRAGYEGRSGMCYREPGKPGVRLLSILVVLLERAGVEHARGVVAGSFWRR